MLAIETVLEVTKEIVGMDDINDVQQMPLAAVLLLKKARSMAIALEHYRNRDEQMVQYATASLERARWRWKIGGLSSDITR